MEIKIKINAKIELATEKVKMKERIKLELMREEEVEPQFCS